MVENTETSDTAAEETPAPRPKASPIESRFLFVDVAALRAKQLRRGAILRLEDDDTQRVRPFKCERLAMEEVRRGLVLWEVPPAPVDPHAP